MKIKYLLDTHIILALIEERQHELPQRIIKGIVETSDPVAVSVLSLWEIDMKSRAGKLPIATPLMHWPDALFLLGAFLMEIEFRHVVADIVEEPATKDPFDRLLLSICAAEGMKLVTLDRALENHPLAWREV